MKNINTQILITTFFLGLQAFFYKRGDANLSTIFLNSIIINFLNYNHFIINNKFKKVDEKFERLMNYRDSLWNRVEKLEDNEINLDDLYNITNDLEDRVKDLERFNERDKD